MRLLKQQTAEKKQPTPSLFPLFSLSAVIYTARTAMLERASRAKRSLATSIWFVKGKSVSLHHYFAMPRDMLTADRQRQK